MEQRSDEWCQARLGKPTASQFHKIIAKGEGKTRQKYLYQLAAERLTGTAEEGYINEHMLRGIEQEPIARLQYEAKTGCVVQEVGFIQHTSLAVGCSPDGLIDDDGGCEIKCVLPTVQIETMTLGRMPSHHEAQVQGNLWITDRKWWDFVSYCGTFHEPERKLIVYRVQRDDKYIAVLQEAVKRFLDDLNAICDAI